MLTAPATVSVTATGARVNRSVCRIQSVVTLLPASHAVTLRQGFEVSANSTKDSVSTVSGYLRREGEKKTFVVQCTNYGMSQLYSCAVLE